MPTRLAALFVLVAVPAGAQDGPLSAIDWLSQSVATPASAGVAVGPRDEPPVSSGGALPTVVATTPLDGPSPDAVGLISPSVSGLPADLWGAGRIEEIATAIARDRMDSLPALRQLFLTILLAEARAPADAGTGARHLMARIDKLLTLGALEQAAALIDLAGISTPDLFRRAFDTALLTGNEDRACVAMQSDPGLAPTLQARVFCLARAGNWDAAALTLHTAEALKQVSPDQVALLARFLDPDLFEGEAPPPPPNPVTPLDWKMFEAIGEPLSTAVLPVAFAYAEIGPTFGWKARIEAAERLTRAGTIAPNVILGLYTEREPAASGGVWDRVAAFQALDAALAGGDPARIAAALPEAWAQMQEVELEVPFAQLYGRALAAVPLTEEAAAIALRVALLSPDAAKLAPDLRAMTPVEVFLLDLAQGRITPGLPPDSMARAIAPAFATPRPSAAAQTLLDGRRLGEAILQGIEDIARGVEGDMTGITEGLSLLRAVGLETVARRTALELLILERRG